MLSSYVCLAGLLTLLVVAALMDLRARRIPNWLTSGVAALYPVYLILSPNPVAWPSALALALLVGSLGVVLFARQLIGGGDVKLIAAITLWAGLEHFAVFALVTTLTGGALAVAILWLQRWNPLIQAHLAGFGTATASQHDGARRADGQGASDPPGAARPVPATLPYGIAIAVGGVAVVIELMKF